MTWWVILTSEHITASHSVWASRGRGLRKSNSSCDLGCLWQICKISSKTALQPCTHTLQLDWTQLRQQTPLATVSLAVKGLLVRKRGVREMHVGGPCLFIALALCWECPKGSHPSKHRWKVPVKTTEQWNIYSLIFWEPSQDTSLCLSKKKGVVALTVLVTCTGMCHVQSQLCCSL